MMMIMIMTMTMTMTMTMIMTISDNDNDNDNDNPYLNRVTPSVTGLLPMGPCKYAEVGFTLDQISFLSCGPAAHAQ